jgi:arylsulfatase A-like enzyme
VLIVVTGDHGVSTAPEEALAAARIPVGRGTDAAVVRAMDAALDAAFGAADWVVEGVRTSPNVYLNLTAASERHVLPEEMQRIAALAASQATVVYVAFSRTQILTGQLPPWDFTRLVVNGFHPRLGGDVYVVPQPGWLLSGPPDASHGSPWAPDTHVPLVLRGPGITPGPQYRRVTPMDIVPTLSQVLGIGYPSGCVGEPLHEALAGR